MGNGGTQMGTPREVMFEEIYLHWGVSNKALARAIVRHDSVTSGKSPVELIEVRSSLSRFVVHVNPGENVYGWIAPYEQVVPRVMALLKRSKKPHDSASILSALTGECAQAMRLSLEQHGDDGALFMNVARRIGEGEVSNNADAAETALALFVVAGCAGDAREAARYAVGMMDRLAMAAELRTRYASPEKPIANVSGGLSHMGLYRLQNGKLAGSPHVLNESPDGTEIGSLSLAEHSINDVGPGVSRRHARIWRDGGGAWWIEDLGSTNGTVVVSAGGERVVVGLPKSSRSGHALGRAPLEAGARIILAGQTEFAVVEMASTQRCQ